MEHYARRRWRRNRITASEAVVWIVVTAMTAGGLIGFCLLLTLAWPS